MKVDFYSINYCAFFIYRFILWAGIISTLVILSCKHCTKQTADVVEIDIIIVY